MSIPPVGGSPGSSASINSHVEASILANGDTVAPMSLLDYLTTLGGARSQLQTVLSDTASGAAAQTDPYYKVLLEAYQNPSSALFDQISSIFNSLRSSLTFATNRAVELNEPDQASGSIVLPPSFAARASPAAGDTSGSGSSDLLIANSLGPGDRNLQRILSSALYKAILLQFRVDASQGTLDQLKTLSIGLIGRSAQSAAQSTARSLSGNAVSSSSSGNAVGVASALLFANSALSFSSAPEVKSAIENILNSDENFANLSAEDKESALKQFTAAFKIGILNVALAQVSNGVGLSGLSAQILGNVQGSNPANAAPAPSDNANVNNVLDNPISIAFLESSLTAILNKENAGQASALLAPQAGTETGAKSIVYNAIALILSNPYYKNAQELENALLKAFQQQGINKNSAAALAHSAIGIIRSEATLPPLDKYLIKEKFGALAAFFGVTAVVPPLPPGEEPQAPLVSTSGTANLIAEAELPQQEEPPAPPIPTTEAVNIPTLQPVLLGQLQAEFDENSNVLPALQEALAAQLTTVRELRSNLLDELLANGVRTEEANRITEITVRLLTSPQPQPSVTELGTLHNPEPQKIVPLPSLAEDLSNYLQPQLTKETDAYRASILTDKTIRTLIGSNSILSEYNNQIRILREKSNQDAIDGAIASSQRRQALDEAIAEGLSSITRPSLPLYALRQQVNQIINTEITQYMDPIAQDSLTRSSTLREPTNFKRNLDIRI